MIIDGKKLASMCDVGTWHALSTKDDVDYAIDMAIRYQACSVFTPKCWCRYAADRLKGTGINLEFSICAPAGHDDIEHKVFGAKRYVELGLTEVETYLNFSYLKSKMYKECLADLVAVRQAIPADMIMKVIIQTGALTDDEIRIASQMVVDAGANFVKTGNGEYGMISYHAVDLIAKTVQGKAKIKATGPFYSIGQIYDFLDLGASRFGIGTAEMIQFCDLADRAAAKK